jgi:hypothetical protein
MLVQCVLEVLEVLRRRGQVTFVEGNKVGDEDILRVHSKPYWNLVKVRPHRAATHTVRL